MLKSLSKSILSYFYYQNCLSTVRSHWSRENSLHWVLDVTFNEDASRIRQGHAAENLGLLCRLSINLLKREPSQQSLKMKRYKAGMDNDFIIHQHRVAQEQ